MRLDAEDWLWFGQFIDFVAMFLENARSFRESSSGLLIRQSASCLVMLIVVARDCRNVVALLLLLVIQLLQLVSLNLELLVVWLLEMMLL